MNEPGHRWRVGELAKAAGLTVRTLHHYEQVGLLSPGARTEGRHRIFDARDVRRLYQDLISEFAGGDRATIDALTHLRRAAPPKRFGGWTPALMRYLDEALAALPAKEE